MPKGRLSHYCVGVSGVDDIIFDRAGHVACQFGAAGSTVEWEVALIPGPPLTSATAQLFTKYILSTVLLLI